MTRAEAISAAYRLRLLPVGWDGRQSPAPTTVAVARTVAILRGLVPRSVVEVSPMVGGGVQITSGDWMVEVGPDGEEEVTR